MKISVLRNFTKFTGNTCARVSFLIKLQVLGLQFASLDIYIELKKSISSLDSFWRYWTFMNIVIWLVKNISTYAWLHLIDISGISIKRHFKLIYHFEVLWAYPAAPGQAQLIFSWMFIHIKKLTLCFNSFMKYWIFRNLAFWLVKSIFDNRTNPKNFAWYDNWNGKSSITMQGFPNNVNG